MNDAPSIENRIAGLRGRVLPVALVLVVLAGAAWWLERDAAFYPAYLIGFTFCLGITLGSLLLLMLHHLAGGWWGYALRRVLEAATRTLPLMAVLFVPILLAGPRLFPWMAEEAAHDPVIMEKAWYLNTPGFVVRAVICFAVWGLLIFLLNRWSARQDENGEAALNRPMRMLSGIGVVLYVLAVTVASWDWGMSLEPHWFSAIYGPWYLISQGLTTLAFGIVILTWLAQSSPVREAATPKVFHDIGNLTFAFVILWAYMSVSQFLIIWSGNLPEETPYYIARSNGGWQAVAAVLALFHFALPVLLLLIRHNKLRAGVLTVIAWLILLMRFVDLGWAIYPAFTPGRIVLNWAQFVVPLALVAVFVWFFLGNLRARALLPRHDPRFEGEAVGHD